MLQILAVIVLAITCAVMCLKNHQYRKLARDIRSSASFLNDVNDTQRAVKRADMAESTGINYAIAAIGTCFTLGLIITYGTY